MQVWKLLVALIISCINFQFAGAKTYEEVFTDKAGRAYSEDINIWTYTSEFAERFAMPKEWVDDGLKGAYAVAFRVETRSNRTKFPHKGPDVSIPNRDCILDVYLDERASIPWVSKQSLDIWVRTPSSPAYLLPQTIEDSEWRRRPIGIATSGNLSREPLVYMGRVGNKMGGSVFIREYDKQVYPGIVYISLNRTCMTPPRHEAWIEFMRDGNWNYGKHQSHHIAHRVEIPKFFMVQLYDLWFEHNRKPAVENWKKVTR